MKEWVLQCVLGLLPILIKIQTHLLLTLRDAGERTGGWELRWHWGQACQKRRWLLSFTKSECPGVQRCWASVSPVLFSTRFPFLPCFGTVAAASCFIVLCVPIGSPNTKKDMHCRFANPRHLLSGEIGTLFLAYWLNQWRPISEVQKLRAWESSIAGRSLPHQSIPSTVLLLWTPQPFSGSHFFGLSDNPSHSVSPQDTATSVYHEGHHELSPNHGASSSKHLCVPHIQMNKVSYKVGYGSTINLLPALGSFLSHLGLFPQLVQDQKARKELRECLISGLWDKP